MTINNYIMLVGSNPFTNTDFMSNGYAPLNDTTFQSVLTDYISFNHGELNIRYTLEDSVLENPSIIQNAVVNWYNTHKYQYETLYNTTLLKYEPLQNYNRTEEVTDSTERTGTNDTTFGSRTDTSTANNTTNIGAQDNTNKDDETTKIGVINTETNSSTSKKGSESNEKEVAPYDSETYYNQEKDTLSFTNRTDTNNSTTTTNARTDTRTNTTTEKIGGRKDTTESSTSNTFGGHTDATSRNENETYTHKSHMYGNIGVTTSQQMLESEREVAYFNFVSIVAHDIIKLIAICIY